MLQIEDRGEDRKISYCERAYDLLKRRRLMDMDLDELARAVERSLHEENDFRVENPERGTSLLTRIRNTIYKQTGGGKGWKNTLTRKQGVMKRWKVYLTGGSAKDPANQAAPTVRPLTRTTERRVQVAIDAGFSLEQVVVAGLDTLADDITHALKVKYDKSVKALQARKR